MRIIVTCFLILTLYGCKVYNNVIYKNSNEDLEYINYYTSVIRFPNNKDFVQNKKCTKKHLSMNERKNLESFGEKIIGELFDTLMNIDLINSWKEKFILPIYNSTYIDPFEYISMKRKEYILETKKISSLYYLGEFNLSENFKSYLIKRRTFYEPIYVHSIVYLINVIDGAICSIVPVNSVFTPDYFYCTKQIEKNLFVYGSLDFQGKVKNRKMTYWNNSTLFYFDEKGFLRIM